jgi:hypothetical protein
MVVTTDTPGEQLSLRRLRGSLENYYPDKAAKLEWSHLPLLRTVTTLVVPVDRAGTEHVGTSGHLTTDRRESNSLAVAQVAGVASDRHTAARAVSPTVMPKRNAANMPLSLEQAVL